MRAILQWLVISTGCVGVAGWLGGSTAAASVAAGALGFLVLFMWLPRAANRAFVRGRFARARRLFWLAGWIRLTPASRRAARLSLSACSLGLGRWQRALGEIDALRSATLTPAERAVWQNNRAYALARIGAEPHEALELIDAAIEARPALAGFVHTRGVALLAAGRTTEAIAALDAVWASSTQEPASTLEAERCYDLGRAWLASGEDDYAFDYFGRARLAAPDSSWANLARQELSTRGADPGAPPTEGIL